MRFRPEREVTITSSVTDHEGLNLVVACRRSLTCLDYGGLYSLTMLRLISAVSSAAMGPRRMECRVM